MFCSFVMLKINVYVCMYVHTHRNLQLNQRTVIDPKQHTHRNLQLNQQTVIDPKHYTHRNLQLNQRTAIDPKHHTHEYYIKNTTQYEDKSV